MADRFLSYAHGAAAARVPVPVRTSLVKALEGSEPLLRKGTVQFRRELSAQLAKDGWSGTVRLDGQSRITVSGARDRIGLCIQTGNAARMYADLLKLETLFRNKAIDGAILVVLSRARGKEIGGNLVAYERLVEELRIFAVTITLPLLVIGIL